MKSLHERKAILIFLSILTFFIVVMLCVNYYTQSFIEKKTNYNKIFDQKIKELKKEWEYAYSFEKLKCPNLTEYSDNIGQNYFRCNPYYFECFLQGYNDKEIQIKEIKSNLKYFKKSKVLAKSMYSGEHIPHHGVFFVLSKNDVFQEVIFENICKSVYLPKKVYITTDKYQWDNFNQNIYIDKFHVSNRDIDEWKQLKGEKSQIKMKDFPKAATNLDKNQMNDYCSFYGKHLLKSHVYDAGVVLTNNKTIYPFPMIKSQRIKKILNEITCKQLYSSECDNKNYYSTYASSWIDIYQVQGGPFEYVENIYSDYNLVLSSKYFSKNSTFHFVTSRGKWDGRDHFLGNFDYDKRENSFFPIKYEVAFRCMFYY